MRNRFIYQSPEPEAGGGGTELVEVDLLSGAKVKLPPDVAKKEIEYRQKYKSDMRAREEEIGKAKATSEAAAAEVEKARQQAESEAAIKAGEFGKAREIYEQNAQKEIKKAREAVEAVAGLQRNAHLQMALSRNDAIIPEAVGDAVQQLAVSCRYNLTTNVLEVVDAQGKARVDADGKPLSVDALLSEYLGTRAYLRKATTTAGSGGKQAEGSNAGKQVMTVEQYNEEIKNPYRAQELSIKLAKNQLIIQ